MRRTDRDAYLDAVLVGGREQREVVVVDYDAGWPRRFEHERARLANALGDRALAIEHIGSTAVPGLAAEPIVDLLVIVEDPDDEPAFGPSLIDAGYELRVREPGHRMFSTPAHDVHVHVRAPGDPEIDRHLAFRDHLRNSPADRDRYARLKRALAARTWTDMNHYADAKGPLIEEILAAAAATRTDQSAPPGPATRRRSRRCSASSATRPKPPRPPPGSPTSSPGTERARSSTTSRGRPSGCSPGSSRI